MLIDYTKPIQDTLHALREEITLMIIRLSEDSRNEPLRDKLALIRDNELMQACTIASRGTEDALGRAVESAQNGLLKFFEIKERMLGVAPDGRKLSRDERIEIYPVDINEDREGREYEEILGADGQKIKNYNLSIPFKEVALIGNLLNHVYRNTSTELKSFGADTGRLEGVYKKCYNVPLADIEDTHYLFKLRDALQSTCTRLKPKKDSDFQPNLHVIRKLYDLDGRIGAAAGEGWIPDLVDMFDPAEALSKPPPPSHDEVIQRYDGIFKELHVLLYSPDMEGLTLLRNTLQCKLGVQGSVRVLKDALKRAVRDLEDKGNEFPEYHSVADRGRRRK